MEHQALETVVRDIDVRLARVEQILPTLATEEGVRNSIAAAIAEAVTPLATKVGVESAIAEAVTPLATKAEVKAAIAEAVRPLATKAEVESAIAEAVRPLATKAEVESAIAEAVKPLATKAELERYATKADLTDGLTHLEEKMRQEGERTRRHFDAVAEQMADRFRFLADAHVAIGERLDRRIDVVEANVGQLDVRVTRLEAQRRRR